MVTNVTSLSRTGLYDWMLQRLTAIVLGVYFCFLLTYLVLNPDLDYIQWTELFDQTWIRIFTIVALISVMAHAWIGMWTITTDYLNERALGDRSVLIRFPVQVAFIVVLFSYLIWGVQILWGL